MSNGKRDEDVSRRKAIQGLGVSLGLAAVSCGTSGDDGGEGPVPAPTGNATTTPTVPPPASTTPPKEDPPLGPKELLAGIEHIVVLMMENRSFDHFLGSLKSDAGYASKASVNGLTGTETNPAPDGTLVNVFKMANFTPEDPPHGWDACHGQFNAGKNDGFVKAHQGDTQEEVMGFHDRSQIPLYYWFADNFAICDNWFASVMGPTWPNRFYLHAASSKGKKDNTPFLAGAPESLWEALKEQKIEAKNYYAGAISWYVGGFAGKVLQVNPTVRLDQFFTAAKEGKLPAFSIIDPDFQASDDHPAHNIQRGQAFVASIYKALADSPTWAKTLFIITYDEHGGFYDHVPPPKTADGEPEFEQLGFRVPSFVIGPTVKKGFVSKVQYDHSSVAATLRARFGMKDLNPRMKAAKDISDCIDPTKVKAPAAPPAGMPQVAMTMEQALHHGVGEHSQPMLETMVAKGQIRASDVDSRTHEQRIGDWLEHAVRLGVVRIVKS